ncbi:hypothetical protein IJJ46_01700 [Candidatus Saccharibacteria bacterium]|nr:hypothetical protein [Candidatus Saccharibacteria bacterium]
MSFTARLKKRLYFVAAGYFRFFANFAFKRWHPRVIAITGSVGKTTMLHLVEFELGGQAHYSHDANSAFGIAFDLVGLRGITGSKLRWIYLILAVPFRSIYYRHRERYYIVEIDGERPHETEFLASWLKPEVTLWISLGRSHAVQFENQVKEGVFENLDKAITHEFAMLPEYTQKMIMIDGDVPLMVKATQKIIEKGKTTAEVRACSKKDLQAYVVQPDSTDYTISGKQTTNFHFASPQPRDLAIQLVMLRELTDYLQHPLKTDFTKMPLPPGRSSYFEGKNGLKLIDSSYNAHLISVASILDLSTQLKVRPKWLVIGDIVDQGSIEGEEHTKLADLIAKSKPDRVILVGRRTHAYTLPKLKALGYVVRPDGNLPVVRSYDDVKQALADIEQNATGNETIIFKGSQYLEWIIEKLLKNPEDAKKLPRREAAAVKRREKRGLK